MSLLNITQVVDEDTRIDIREPKNSWQGYLVIEARDRLTVQSVVSMYITREKAAELRDLLDDALADALAADESAAEASIAQVRAVGS